MEEVDKILILSLNHLGCDINEGEVKNVGDLGVGGVVGGVVRCIKAINTDTDLPTSLPHNMAQRFRVAAAVAHAIKDIGYPGDVGYQSLLYPNESDIRKIFMFLIEKLPKDTAVVSDEPLNRASLIHNEAKRKANESLSRPWLPPHCCRVLNDNATPKPTTRYGTQHIKRFNSACFSQPLHPSKVPSDMVEYYKTHLRRISTVVGLNKMFTSLLNNHAVQLASSASVLTSRQTSTDEANEDKGSINLETVYGGSGERSETKSEGSGVRSLDREWTAASLRSAVSPFLAATQMIDVRESDKQSERSERSEIEADPSKTTEEEIQAKREEQISSLQVEIAEIGRKIESCTEGIRLAEESIAEIEGKIEAGIEAKREEAEDLKVKRKTASLLPESETNLQRLKNALRNSEEKMERLKGQWEEHRKPLSETIGRLSLQLANTKNKKEESLSELSSLRDKMRAMVQDAGRKETALVQLKDQVDRMNRDINRSMYTKRIADISAKVRKQKREIERVLSDTHAIQKEINTLSGKLERTFTVLEGTAYKEAGSKEKVRAVYRAVAGVHEGCGQLVDIIRDTGAVQREIADLREQVDLEKSKKIEDTLEQLKVDLVQVKKENSVLKEQLGK